MEENKKMDFQIFSLDDTNYLTKLTKKFENRTPYKAPNEKMIVSFIPGTVKQILVKEKQSVKKGTPLMILDAMKMLNKLLSPVNGKVKSIKVKEGSTVSKGELMIELS
jgi:biotin carboxyl carrier protein